MIRLTMCLLIGIGVTACAPSPPPWNRHARQFIRAPVLQFDDIAKDGQYTVVRGADGSRHEIMSRYATVDLAPIWNKLPVGTTRIRNRTFHRAAPFHGPYGSAIVPYGESAHIAMKSVLHEPFVRSWIATGRPDESYALYRYAGKVIGSLVGGCARHARECPEDRDEAIAIARAGADYLIAISAPAGSPLEFFPPTYHGAKATERENDRWTMMMTPAEAGQGYLELFDVTRDRKYLDAALRIGDTYAKTQLKSDTWPLKVDNQTGEPVADVELIPSEVIRFLDRLDRTRYRSTLDRAVKWMMENPVRTFDWKAQFDDAKVRGPYENLSKHEACMFADYLFRHRREMKRAEEILRWAEDQFVVWEQPPELAARSENLQSKYWITPSSCEQYAMFEPISGSSAFMMVAYLSAFEATGKPLYLAKARSLANALTIAQQKHGGRYPTRMMEKDLAYWINSTINTARAMHMLARFDRIAADG